MVIPEVPPLKETVPLKPLTPCTFTMVDMSLVPRETDTYGLLSETLKSVGVIVSGKLRLLLSSGCGGLRTPSPAAVTPTV